VLFVVTVVYRHVLLLMLWLDGMMMMMMTGMFCSEDCVLTPSAMPGSMGQCACHVLQCILGCSSANLSVICSHILAYATHDAHVLT
jgi:hypothetical protein